LLTPSLLYAFFTKTTIILTAFLQQGELCCNLDNGGRMHIKKHHPSWWQLYLSFPLMIGLFLIETHQPLTEAGHKMIELFILLIFFGYISLWLKANTGAMIQEDLDKWHAALGVDSSPISSSSLKILHKNRNMSRRQQRARGNIFKRLAGLGSAVSGLFH
jgi:peptidoglycan/LPS O-acetylase OafA/YrhL